LLDGHFSDHTIFYSWQKPVLDIAGIYIASGLPDLKLLAPANLS